MKRAIARGRIVPQSLSTDPRIGHLSLKAALLYDRLWINCDDQGRISGDPAEIKYATCPNIDHITKEEIPELLKELQTQELIKLYSTSKVSAIQMLDWWQEQKLQWAWPSRFPPPEGWQDRLRYKKSAKEVVTFNWGSGENSGEGSGEGSPLTPLTTPIEKEKRKGKRRGKSPEGSGEKATTTEKEILKSLSSLKGWKVDEEDLAWLREFMSEFPAFNLAHVKACRDYHSGRAPPKHKGIWKNRFRNWMIKKQEFERRDKAGGKPKSKRAKGPLTYIRGSEQVGPEDDKDMP